MANPIVAEEFGLTKKLLAWAERAAKQGLDLSTDLQSSIDDPVLMKRIVRYIRVGTPELSVPGVVYDAAAVSRILGIPAKCSHPVPKAEDGGIVVYYGGWNLKQLRKSSAGKKCMWQDQDWYEKYGWKAKSGYYRLLLSVNWSKQLRFLAQISASWQAAPVCVAATALLVHLTETGNNLLKNDWCGCAETLLGGSRAALTVDGGRVRVCRPQRHPLACCVSEVLNFGS